ncbi:hypothetical protein C1H46_033758 [Malus baccata]|uniref:Uncharacterized protein n=1 Tax=Malus baccata TaxID=106549 RepID=A0A540L2V1_MALBA|nr:hypothetical protein C1H46_033758 [Malus baccata]
MPNEGTQNCDYSRWCEFCGIGRGKHKVVVTGERMDAIKLAKSLRKKFKAADIITVAEVK